jgi:hypothetical protein
LPTSQPARTTRLATDATTMNRTEPSLRMRWKSPGTFTGTEV